MGLDNIPKTYPCKKQNLAVLDEQGRIDCKKTQDLGHCPYTNLRNSDPMVKDLPATYGIFGTDCWYRGKYGNFLLDVVNRYFDVSPSVDFYGDVRNLDENGNPVGLKSDKCLELSDWMINHTESFFKAAEMHCNDVEVDRDSLQHLKGDWIYASWWLRFAANFCDGSDVWY